MRAFSSCSHRVFRACVQVGTVTAARRVLLVLVVSVIATAGGYGVSRLFSVSDRRPDAPVIDLDNLPLVDAPPPTVAVGNGATILPPPTLAPAPTSPPPPVPTSPPPPPLDDDDEDDDGDDDDGDGDDDDAGELDD